MCARQKICCWRKRNTSRYNYSSEGGLNWEGGGTLIDHKPISFKYIVHLGYWGGAKADSGGGGGGGGGACQTY